MIVLKDRVKQIASVPVIPTGTLSLGPVPNGYQAFGSVLASGDQTYYVIETSNSFEIGIGRYGIEGSGTLTRDTVLTSSTGSKLSLTSRATVFITVPAAKFPFTDPSGELNLALNTLSDVGLAAPASGQSLVYNGSSWANSTITGYTTEEAQDAVGGILADTSSISFSYNDGTPSISASVRSSGITDVMISGGVDALKIGSGTVSSTEFGYLDGVTSSLQGQLDSKYDSANPSGYISASGVAAAYQPLDADLTSLASASGSGIYERSGGNWTPVVIGSGLSLGSGTLSNTLDLSAYLPLAGGTLTGDLLFTDATYDIGKSGATRPRDGFFSRDVVIGGSGEGTLGLMVSGSTKISFRASGAGSYINAGNFGVGNSLPSTKFHVTGQSLFDNATVATAKNFITCNMNGTNYVQIYDPGISGSGGGVAIGGASAVTTVPTIPSLFVNANSILVGVGTSTPVTTLDVAGTVSLRNSTSPTQFNLHNTYTSATSFENLQFKAVTGGAYQIGSAIGSAGGTNRAITFGHWNAAGAFVGTACITDPSYGYGARFSDNGGAAEGAEQFGQNSLTSYQSLAVGGFAHASANYGTAIGRCSYAGQFCTVLGRNAGTTGTTGGFPTAHAYTDCITISSGIDDVAPTASYQFIVAGRWTEAFFGRNVAHATPLDVRFNATGGSGTNIAGASFTLAGGKGTGTGLGGSLRFQVAPAGSTGSTANALVDALVIDSTKLSTFTGPIILTQPASTFGSPTALTVTGAAHTTLSLSTEATDVNFNLARTVQFATGAISTQRAMRIQAPTYSFVAASTITTASTLSISGAPVAGTNATITNAFALNVESGHINCSSSYVYASRVYVGDAYFATTGAYAWEIRSTYGKDFAREGGSGLFAYAQITAPALASNGSQNGCLDSSVITIGKYGMTGTTYVATALDAAIYAQKGGAYNATTYSTSRKIYLVTFNGGNAVSGNSNGGDGGSVVAMIGAGGTGTGSGVSGANGTFEVQTAAGTMLTRVSYDGALAFTNDTFDQRNSTAAQTFRIAGTWTSTTSYERLNLKGKASANFEIGPESGSAGGTLRGLTLGCYPAGTATIVGWAQFRPNTSTGALEAFYLGPIADSTAAGGNARGQYAVDLQTVRSAASQVASGVSSFCSGQYNTASGAYSTAVGYSNLSGPGSFTSGFGNSVTGNWNGAIGYSNTVTGGDNGGCFATGKSNTINVSSNCTAFVAGYLSSVTMNFGFTHGVYGSATRLNQYSHGGDFGFTTGVLGGSQYVRFLLGRKTTDDTPTTLMLDGSSTRLTIPSGKTMSCKVTVKGIKSDGSAKARFVRLVEITNVGGTTSLDMSPEALGTDYNPSGCACDITADNTNDALDISVTGITSETWRWVAVVEGLEIAYGT